MYDNQTFLFSGIAKSVFFRIYGLYWLLVCIKNKDCVSFMKETHNPCIRFSF